MSLARCLRRIASMMKLRLWVLTACVTVLAMLVSTGASAGTIQFSGTLDGTDPTFDNPGNVAVGANAYDLFEFLVDTSGTYSFLGLYPGDTTTDANLDGYLLLYANAFNPAAPAGFIASDDDYASGGFAALAAYDGACIGQNCSAFETALTAGTSYFVVQTSFSDAPTSFGQPTGPYDLTITGPGTITQTASTPVPEPGTALLLLSGILGLGARRRRRTSLRR